MSNRVEKFLSGDPQYRCCCRLCHSKTATLVVAIVEMAVVISAVIILFSSDCSGSVAAGMTAWEACVGLAVVCLMIGLYTDKHLFILPHLILQALSLLATAVFLGVWMLFSLALWFGVAVAIDKAENFYKESEKTGNFEIVSTIVFIWIILMVVIIAIVLWIQAWFFTVVYAYYRYLKDMAELIANPSNIEKSLLFK